jgi:hypothetical protein
MKILQQTEVQIQPAEAVHRNPLLQILPHQEAVQEEIINNF